jgi:hypothetical protein
LYHPHAKAVTILDLILRVPGIRKGDMELDMLKALMRRIQKDVGKGGDGDYGGSDSGSGSGGVGSGVGSGVGGGAIRMVMETSFTKWRTQMTKVGFLERVFGVADRDILAMYPEEMRRLMESRKDGVCLTMNVADLMI